MKLKKTGLRGTDDFLGFFVVSDVGTSANGLLVLEGTKLSLCKFNIVD